VLRVMNVGLSSRGAQCCSDLACAWCLDVWYSVFTRTLSCQDSTTWLNKTTKTPTRFHLTISSTSHTQLSIIRLA